MLRSEIQTVEETDDGLYKLTMKSRDKVLVTELQLFQIILQGHLLRYERERDSATEGKLTHIY